ncbi:hypothetical protein Tco_0119929 [Tanacetum coccineum]
MFRWCSDGGPAVVDGGPAVVDGGPTRLTAVDRRWPPLTGGLAVVDWSLTYQVVATWRTRKGSVRGQKGSVPGSCFEGSGSTRGG